jgi:hypothetical protein
VRAEELEVKGAVILKLPYSGRKRGRKPQSLFASVESPPCDSHSEVTLSPSNPRVSDEMIVTPASSDLAPNEDSPQFTPSEGIQILPSLVGERKNPKIGRGRGYKTDGGVSDAVKAIYGKIGKMTGGVGGAIPCAPLYGEITMVSFHKVLTFLIEKCGLSEGRTSVLDVGSGLGKPSLHVSADPRLPNVVWSFGIEVNPYRCV